MDSDRRSERSASKGLPAGDRVGRSELEEYHGEEINRGRLYPNLDTLVTKGLVEKGRKDRRTNYYVATARGRRELEARRGWENERLDEGAATDAAT